ncbi:MAG: ArsR/SmtB family transcription factor [Candidatus Thermochlorobacter sp.]
MTKDFLVDAAQRDTLALKMKALSHPVRLEIIQILKSRGYICGELVALLQLAQATVSQHLKVLKDAGFIQSIKIGSKVCYSLNHQALSEFKEMTCLL